MPDESILAKGINLAYKTHSEIISSLFEGQPMTFLTHSGNSVGKLLKVTCKMAMKWSTTYMGTALLYVC